MGEEDSLRTQGARLQAWRQRQKDPEGATVSQEIAAKMLARFTEDGQPASQSAWASWELGQRAPDIYFAFALQRMTKGEIQVEWWGRRRHKADKADRAKKRRRQRAEAKSA